MATVHNNNDSSTVWKKVLYEVHETVKPKNALDVTQTRVSIDRCYAINWYTSKFANLA